MGLNKCTIYTYDPFIHNHTELYLPKTHANSVFLKRVTSDDKIWLVRYTSQWRHNERDGVSNHQCVDGLFIRLFRSRSKKTSKLRDTGLREGNSPGTVEFPPQRAGNAENVSIWCCHHVDMYKWVLLFKSTIQISTDLHAITITHYMHIKLKDKNPIHWKIFNPS